VVAVMLCAVARGQTAVDVETTKVAVIGGGIGGATTVLELMEAGFKEITLFEKSDDLFQSTSSMIAATVNFETFYRKDWKPSAGLSQAFAMFRAGNKRAKGRVQRERWFEFMGHSALNQLFPDQRSEETQRRKIFRISRRRLIHHIKLYPEICDAAIGYWCC
jgi:glycine/D-amino acid oxidase-like deaminating enzyme